MVTAKEFQNAEYQLLNYGRLLTLEEMLIKFTELHIKEFAEAVFLNSKVRIAYAWDAPTEFADQFEDGSVSVTVSKDSIINTKHKIL